MMLLFAVVRLGGIALELKAYTLESWQVALGVAWLVYMVWAEGYKGFHLAFAPRVVARANYLAGHPRPLHVILAPLFCMGYIHATTKRRLMSIGLSLMIVCFVLVARLLPQPWRGIVDAGVVAGLVFGMASIVFYLTQLWQGGAARLPVPADVPA